MMIGLDTNVLARYYIFDANDAEALRQRPLAQGLIDSTQALVVCKTVIIEFEWLMRRHYKMKRAAILAIFQHVQSLPNLTIEDRPPLPKHWRTTNLASPLQTLYITPATPSATA
jgi:predicted nucleic-acid-binding protein